MERLSRTFGGIGRSLIMDNYYSVSLPSPLLHTPALTLDRQILKDDYNEKKAIFRSPSLAILVGN